MKTKWYIVAFLLVLLPCLAGYSGDVLDDVYYWEDETAPHRFVVEEQEEMQDEPMPQWVTITFIEDSITQHSDTVVRAVIQRY